MAKKRIVVYRSSIEVTPARSARVDRDTEWQEYTVEFSLGGAKQEDATYHTSDREDAQLTAIAWVSGLRVERDGHASVRIHDDKGVKNRASK